MKLRMMKSLKIMTKKKIVKNNSVMRGSQMAARAVELLPCMIGGNEMAKKTRYRKYAEGMQKMYRNQKRKSTKSSSKSVLKKLKQLKAQEFHMTIPIGETDGE